MSAQAVSATLRKAKTHAKAGEFAAAAALYETVLARFPGNQTAQKGLRHLPAKKPPEGPPRKDLQAVAAALSAGEFGQAVTAAHHLTERYPGSAAAWNLQGVALGKQGALEAGLESLTKALELAPRQADIWCNQAMLLAEAGQSALAITCYKQALEFDPSHPGACKALGDSLQAHGAVEEACALYRAALPRTSGSGVLHEQIGHCLFRQGAFEQARDAYRSAAELMPEQGSIWAQIDMCTRRLCDWDALDEVTSERLLSAPFAPPPWGALMRCDDPVFHRDLSRAFARRLMPKVAPPPFMPGRPPKDRLRVGFFSSDVHAHATFHLLSGVLRCYDRTRFEFVLFSYGAFVQDDMRRQILAQVDQVHDLSSAPDADFVATARAADLDIAVDLKGYTFGHRTALFAQRLAPVQISYLGYPGTLGSSAFDYLIADAVVVPEDQASAYDEKIIRMPRCYQPNDDARSECTGAGRRDAHGLTPQGFVFCNFNHAAKIGPREFDLWMRVLSQVPAAQLWLLHDTAGACARLQRAAETRGIDAGRLVFAPHATQTDHIARHVHADLVLDSLTCNGHTTSADALWACVPLLTRQGAHFAARVGASLLTASDLPELITHSDADYVKTAVELAHDPERRAALRARTRQARRHAALFDTAAYTRALQAALREAFDQWNAGHTAKDIWIGDVP